MRYEELVKGLREHAERFDYDGWVDAAIWFEKAADAIEELSRKVVASGFAAEGGSRHWNRRADNG